MKSWLWILVALVCLQSAFATLSIQPNPMGLSVKQNEPQTFQATFRNNHSFKILDFEFSNTTGFSFPSLEIESNSSKTIEFEVNHPDAGVYAYSTNVAFKYLVDLPDEPQTHTINITPSGFSTTSLLIRQGDTVKWRNIDNITRTITSKYFDYDILPNQENQYIFNIIETVIFEDFHFLFNGEITVVNASESEKVNNPNLDITWNFNINVILDQTTLEVINNQDSYEIGATSSKEGILEITNTGEEIAQRIELESQPDWIEFDESGFNLDVGEKNFVTYHIEPLVTNKEETNVTHSLKIIIQGLNTERIEKTVEVFVPYSELYEEAGDLELFIYYERYCKKYPNTLICNNTIAQPNQSQIIISDPQIPINISSRKVYEMLRRIQRMEDSDERTNNQIKIYTTSTDTRLTNLELIANESLRISKETKEDKESKETAYTIIAFFIFLSLCTVGIFYSIKKRKEKTRYKEGGVKPKYYG